MLKTIYRRGDIIEVDLGKLEECKQGGKRPCIIVANDMCNKFSPVIHVVPITSRLDKKRMVTHILIKRDCMNNLKYDSLILAEQINLINVNQILGYIGKASDIFMKKVDKKLKLQLALEDKPDINRVKAKIKTLKEMENYILKHNENSAELLNILKFQVSDFKDYCEEYNVDCSQYYVSKFNIINRYLQRNIAA